MLKTNSTKRSYKKVSLNYGMKAQKAGVFDGFLELLGISLDFPAFSCHCQQMF